MLSFAVPWFLLNEAIIIVANVTSTQLINGTINYINNLNLGNISSSLISKLDSISAKLEKGNKTAVINQLNAFINEVSAQSGKKINKEIADTLIQKAQFIISVLI